VEPDAVALAKALGGGVPIGAMVCKEKLAHALPPGSHGSTYGGNPLASAAALTVLETVEQEGLVARAAEMGEYLGGRLRDLAAKHPAAVCQRGQGLLQALVLRDTVDVRELLDRLREGGVLLTVAGGTALRFSPPLIIGKADLDEALGVVDRVLGELS
jgi:acetylornithine/N-succinyldiaminopimelate aminotransferase